MTIAIYGVGSMGGAILDGLVADGQEVLAVVRRPEAAETLSGHEHVEVVAAEEAAARGDVHVVAVKPSGVAELLARLSPHLRAGSVVVSVALGVDLATLRSAVPDGVAVVRAMPNIPARVGEGMTVLSAGEDVSAGQLGAVHATFAATGRTLTLPESQQDAATALSGSAPAYLFLVVEAMVDAGVALGVPRSPARELAVQALVGAGALLRETGAEPGELRAQVTSPGGSTAAALAALEAHGLRHAFAEAVRACADRSAGR